MLAPYIKLTEVGVCDTNRNNRQVGSVGYSGKQVADEKRPMFSLVGIVVRELLPVIQYDSQEQFDEDIATLKALLDRIEYQPAETEGED